MKQKILCLLVALISLYCPSTITAAIIDSFDAGGSSITTSGPKRDFTETNLDTTFVLPGTRTLLISASQNGQTVSANANSSIPGALVLQAPAGISTTFGVEYRPAAHFSVQVPGTNFLMVNFDSISNGATLNVWLRTIANTTEDKVSQVLIPATTTYLFPASSFPNVNFADVESLRVSITTTNGGEFVISQVSTIPEASLHYFGLVVMPLVMAFYFSRLKFNPNESSTTPHPPA